jgi:DNA-binding NarL/FixJ family response regulator
MEAVLKKKDVIVVSEDDAKIMRLYADNKGTNEIAKVLELSNRTIEKRVQKLKKQFKVNTLMALVAVFFRQKLIE